MVPNSEVFYLPGMALTASSSQNTCPPQSIMPWATSVNNTKTPGQPNKWRSLSSHPSSIKKPKMHLYFSSPTTQYFHTKQALSPSFPAKDVATYFFYMYTISTQSSCSAWRPILERNTYRRLKTSTTYSYIEDCNQNIAEWIMSAPHPSKNSSQIIKWKFKLPPANA